MALDYNIANFQLPIADLWTSGDQNRKSAIGNRQFSGLSVVLLEFAVERFAADAEGSCGVGFVAGGVVERSLDREALDLLH